MYEEILNYVNNKSNNIPKITVYQVFKTQILGLRLPLFFEVLYYFLLNSFFIFSLFHLIDFFEINMNYYYAKKFALFSFFLFNYLLNFFKKILVKHYYPLIRDVFFKNEILFLPKEIINKNQDLNLNINQISKIDLKYTIYAKKGDSKLENSNFTHEQDSIKYVSMIIYTDFGKKIKLSGNTLKILDLCNLLEENGVKVEKYSTNTVNLLFYFLYFCIFLYVLYSLYIIITI